MPTLCPQVSDDAALGLLPEGHRSLQNALPLSAEAKHPHALVHSRAAGDKAISLKRAQVAGKGGSFQPETLSKAQERYTSKEEERNEHTELTPAETTGRDGLVMDATNRPGRATEL